MPEKRSPRPRPRLIWGLLLYAAVAVAAGSDVETHRECAYCGMDRKAYGYSRVLVQYQDGSEAGVCSLHCAVVEMDANPGRAVKAIRVADRDTRELVDAEAATWVMGGGKRPVMAARAKWAFATRAAAEAFVGAHGGEFVPWPRALEAARQDVAAEAGAARARRAERPLGCATAAPRAPPPE